MIKTVFSYILFYISCVNAGPQYLRHLSYATGMEGPRNLRHATGMEGPRNLRRSYKLFEKDIEEFTEIYESNY
jgi:hypothetical protein